MMKILKITLLMVLSIMSLELFAAPKPILAPRKGIWTNKVEFAHPKQLTLIVPGSEEPQRFWYMILTVTNQTSQSVPLYLKSQLMTDTYQIVTAGRGVQKYVFDKIKLMNQGRYPFLEWAETVDNKILAGEDNQLDIAIIWPDFDIEAKNVKFFVSGLSNETACIKHPTVLKDGNPLEVCLSKTLEIDYAVPGHKSKRDKQALAYSGKSWIMR